MVNLLTTRVFQQVPDNSGTSGPAIDPTAFTDPGASQIGNTGSFTGTDYSVPSVDSGFGGFGATSTNINPATTAGAIAANPQTPDQTGTGSSNDPQWLSTINKFLTSPVGQLVGAGVPAVYGIQQAASAQRNAQNLTNAISATARPGLNVSNATYGQIMGGPQAPGPLGPYVAGTTSAANQLAQTAGRYATGNLTPAQQMQVAQNQAAQNAQFMTQMGGPGGMGLDSSAAAMMKQQNANNAALLTQQLELQNIQLANAALQGATQTYNALFSSALNQAQLASEATANAVKQQLQANQQVSQQIQAIMQAIAKGMTTAAQPQQPGGAGSATGGGAVAQSPGQTIGQNIIPAARQVASWFGGGNNQQPPIAAGAPTWIPQGTPAAPQQMAAVDPSQLAQVPLTDMPSAPNFNIDTSGGGGATSYPAPDTPQATGP